MNTHNLHSQLTKLKEELTSEYDNLNETKVGRDIYYGFLQSIAQEYSIKIESKYTPNIVVYKEYESKLPNPTKVRDLIGSKPTVLDTLYSTLLSQTSYLNNSGQFFTPPVISNFMTSLVPIDSKDTVLDPACGTGVFIESIQNSTNTQSLTGIDKDPLMVYTSALRSHISKQESDTTLLTQDFLQTETTKKYDIIIGNPPYNKFQNTNVDISDTFDNKYNLSRLSNLYALFFLKSCKLVAKNGYIVLLTPTEYLQTKYGNTLKRVFKDKFCIDKFIKLDWETEIFNALTTVCITVLQKTDSNKDSTVEFYTSNSPDDLDSLLDSERPTTMKQDELCCTDKWTQYFQTIKYKRYLDKTVPLDTFADTKRGISTGYNEYFTFSKSELDSHDIEQKYIQPVLTKSKDAKYYTFTEKDFETLSEKDRKIYLLYYQNGTVSDSLREYINYGEKIDADERYVTSHRNPWYSMEYRDPAPILATVFSRNDMRFIHNQKKVVTLSAFHGIYPKRTDKIWVTALLAYLNSDVALDLLKTQHREYADGLTKLEPGDLSKIPVLDFNKVSEDSLHTLSNLFKSLNKARRDKSTDEQEIQNKLNKTILSLLKKQ